MIENNVTLIGNLTKDVEGQYKQTKKVDENGQPVMFFSGRGKIAVKYDYDRQKKEDIVSFVDFDFSGRKFEKVANYMLKGTKIGISGRIETGSYQNKQGQTVYYTRVRADEVTLLGSPRNKQAPQQAPAQPYQQAPQQAPAQPYQQAPQQAPAQPGAWVPQG